MNLEAFQEVPNAVKEVNKRIVAGANVLGRLIVEDYSVIPPVLRVQLEIQTIKRRPTPPKIAAAGGYACESGQSAGTHLGQDVSNGLTSPILSANTPESEHRTVTVGSMTFINFLLPSRNSRKTSACFRSMPRTSAGDLHVSSLAESGCLARSSPVCLVYSSRAALNTD